MTVLIYCRFYNDEIALGTDRQFLWGGGLLISPVLDEGQTSVDAYFPISVRGNDRWFDYHDVSVTTNKTNQVCAFSSLNINSCVCKLPHTVLISLYLQGSEVVLDGEAQVITVDAPLDVIPLHVRGGYILPTQQHANTTVFR